MRLPTMDVAAIGQRKELYENDLRLGKEVAEEYFTHLQWAMTDSEGPHFGIANHWAQKLADSLEQVVESEVEVAKLSRFLPHQLELQGEPIEVPCAYGVRVVATDRSTGAEVYGRVEQFYAIIGGPGSIEVRLDSEPTMIFSAATLAILEDQS